jgi:hypothetical protein
MSDEDKSSTGAYYRGPAVQKHSLSPLERCQQLIKEYELRVEPYDGDQALLVCTGDGVEIAVNSDGIEIDVRKLYTASFARQFAAALQVAADILEGKVTVEQFLMAEEETR